MKVYYYNSKQLKQVLNESSDTTLSSTRSKPSTLSDRLASFRTPEKPKMKRQNSSFIQIINEPNNNLFKRYPMKLRSNSITRLGFIQLKKPRRDAFGIPINKINKQHYKVSFADRVSAQPLVDVIKYIDTTKRELLSIEEMKRDDSICCCSVV